MVADTLDNGAAYRDLGGGLRKAIEYARSHDLRALPDGKHEIEGAKLFVLIQSYTTRPEAEARLETHRKYLDLQLVLEGREIIYWAPAGELEPDGGYSDERDVAFYKGGVPGALALQAGAFAVFYPQDAHKPCCQWNGPGKVRKAVFKIQV
jgi:biofilm protein TabA